MPSYGGIVEDLEDAVFKMERTRLDSYGEYTLYLENVFYGGIIPDNITLDDCNIYDEDKNKVFVDELPEDVRKEILKDFI